MKQLDDAKAELGQEFPYETELTEKSKRLEELTEMLDISAQEDIKEQSDSKEFYYFEVSEEQLNKLQKADISYDVKEKDGKFLVKVNSDNRKMMENLIKASEHSIKM